MRLEQRLKYWLDRYGPGEYAAYYAYLELEDDIKEGKSKDTECLSALATYNEETVSCIKILNSSR